MNRERIRETVNKLNTFIRGNNISDFWLERVDSGAAYLIGGFDLSYYHDIAVMMTEVEYLALSRYFYVDLSKPEPFQVTFPAEDAAVLEFEDCSVQESGSIRFTGELTVHIEHVVHG